MATDAAQFQNELAQFTDQINSIVAGFQSWALNMADSNPTYDFSSAAHYMNAAAAGLETALGNITAP